MRNDDQQLPQLSSLRKQIKLIDNIMESVCEMADLRLKELHDPHLRELALSKIEQSFQMLQDLCSVNRMLIKEVRQETEGKGAGKSAATHSP
jgi:hypothetical protein